MTAVFSLLQGLTGRITTWLAVFVSLALAITAGIGDVKRYSVTEVNSSIRSDRAARAAAEIFTERLATEYTVLQDDSGTPVAIRLVEETTETSLSFRDEYDSLLREIGVVNQGAANLFRLNPETNAFDRFATTFRRPDGSMPPPMSIAQGHPAFANIANNQPHLGEVPVMGRLRLAYLIPIQSVGGAVAGALAVDVGWVDDLTTARDELRSQIILVSIGILVIVAASGVIYMRRELRPLRELAKHAEDLALEASPAVVPHMNRKDEIGALAQGLDRVGDLQHKLARLAYTDELTQLGNRSRFVGDLRMALATPNTDKSHAALLLLDLDNFKQINDAYGQKSGDALLQAVAHRLVEIAGDTAKVARLTPDQFTILVDNLGDFSQANDLANDLLTALRQPQPLDDFSVYLTASIGVISLQDRKNDSDGALRDAGLAMRAAKADGGDQYIVFSADMNDAFQHQVKLEAMLRDAIDSRDIKLHYQPQINPTTLELAGVEALARWTHPTEGPISPNVFICIAETSGQIVDLGSLVLDMACEQAAKWTSQGFDFKHISVNVSAIQLWRPNFIDVLKSTLDRHGVPGQNIYVEITESLFIDHTENRIRERLDAIRALGVRLSLDDFGSGYSSLGYLNRLPFDQLKIDRGFVMDVDSNLRKRQVLFGIIDLGRRLDFDVVVEGAEDAETVRLIQEVGCNSIQGFYFAKPAPADEIADLIDQISQQGDYLGQRSA